MSQSNNAFEQIKAARQTQLQRDSTLRDACTIRSGLYGVTASLYRVAQLKRRHFTLLLVTKLNASTKISDFWHI